MKKNHLLITFILALLLPGCNSTSIKSISVVNPKAEYTIYDVFEEPTIMVAYSNNEVKEVDKGVAYTGFDLDRTGKQTVTAVYKGFTTTYTISVNKSKYDDTSFITEAEKKSKDLRAVSKTTYSESDFDITFFGPGMYMQLGGNTRANAMIYDLSFYDWYIEFDRMTVEEKEELQEKMKNGPKDENGQSVYTKNTTGSICKIPDDDHRTSVWIPKTISRGGPVAYQNGYAYYNIYINEILDHVFDANVHYTAIYIPKEITRIPASAFSNNDKLSDIYLEHESIPDDFENGWNNTANVHLNCDIYSGIDPDEAYKFEHDGFVPTGDSLEGDNKCYYFGKYYSENERIPLVVEYVESRLDGKNVKRYLEVNPKNQYDKVGYDVGAMAYKAFALPIHPTSTVNKKSIVFHNIYGAEDTEPYNIDVSERYRIKLTII